MPAGVTKLLTFTGKGQDGSPGSPAGFIAGSDFAQPNFYFNAANMPTEASALAALEALMSAMYNQVGCSSTPRVVSKVTVNYTLNTGQTVTVSDGLSWPVNGETTFRGCYPSSVGYVRGLGGNGWCHSIVSWNFEYYDGGTPPTTGSSGSGFGINIPGGDSGTAPTISQSNITVNPGQTYSVLIPSGGYITITYLA